MKTANIAWSWVVHDFGEMCRLLFAYLDLSFKHFTTWSQQAWVYSTQNRICHQDILTTYWANRVGNWVQVETLSFPETYSGQLIEHKKVLLREEGVRGSYLFSVNCLHPCWGLIGERKIKSKYHDYLLGKQGWELSPNQNVVFSQNIIGAVQECAFLREDWLRDSNLFSALWSVHTWGLIGQHIIKSKHIKLFHFTLDRCKIFNYSYPIFLFSCSH